MTQQLSMFTATVKCPVCIYETHCGHRAEYRNERQVAAKTINRDIWCLGCDRWVGVESRKEPGL